MKQENDYQSSFLKGVVWYIAAGVTTCVGILINLDKEHAVLKAKVDTHDQVLKETTDKLTNFELRLSRVEYDKDGDNKRTNERIIPIDAILPNGNSTQKKRGLGEN